MTDFLATALAFGIIGKLLIEAALTILPTALGVYIGGRLLVSWIDRNPAEDLDDEVK